MIWGFDGGFYFYLKTANRTSVNRSSLCPVGAELSLSVSGLHSITQRMSHPKYHPPFDQLRSNGIWDGLSAVFRFNETAYRDHYSVIPFAGW